MTAFAETLRGRQSPLGAALAIVLAVGLGVTVLLYGKWAILAAVGAIAFGVFLRYPVVGLYATTALLLLSGTAGVIGAGGINVRVPITVAKLCGGAAFSAWLLNLLWRRLRWRPNWEVVLVGAFCLWCLAGVVLSANRAEQFPEWVRLATLVAFFVMTVDVLGRSAKFDGYVHGFVVLLLVCGVVSAASAVAQYFLPSAQIHSLAEHSVLETMGKAYVDPESLNGGAAVRVAGRALHSTWLALLILCVLPLNAYWYAVCKTWQGRALVFGVVAIELVALVLTFTRTGLVVGCTLVVLLVGKNLLRTSPHRLAALAVALVASWLVLPSAYKQRVLDFSTYTTSTSVEIRMGLQKAAWDFMIENPILGLGLGGYGPSLVREETEIGQTMAMHVDYFHWNPLFMGVHNLYLQLACETGLVGLAIFLTLFAVIVRRLWQLEKRCAISGDERGRALAASLQVSVAAFLLCAVFLHALQQKIWWMIVAAAVAVSLPDISAHDEPGAGAGETAASGSP